MEEGSQYFCNIQKKKLVVHDIESARDCFISWFQQDNEIMEELKNLIPIEQQKFYDEGFMSISEKEFPNGFKELEFQIEKVEVSQLNN